MKRNNKKGNVLWFTGLSGSGKTTLATSLQAKLKYFDRLAVLLDGDVLRNGLCNDLGFSAEDRNENIRRVTEIAKLLSEQGFFVLVSFISPFQNSREKAKKRIGEEYFSEIYISTPLHICEERDPKGLYKKVRSGMIDEFTGISSPYEIPNNPDLIVNTENKTINEGANVILDFIRNKGMF